MSIIGTLINVILYLDKYLYANKDYLNKNHRFYEKNGSMTIVLGRFISIIRTFVPFVAGVGKINYSKFIVYNMTGGFVGVSIFLWGGFFLGIDSYNININYSRSFYIY